MDFQYNQDNMIHWRIGENKNTHWEIFEKRGNMLQTIQTKTAWTWIRCSPLKKIWKNSFLEAFKWCRLFIVRLQESSSFDTILLKMTLKNCIQSTMQCCHLLFIHLVGSHNGHSLCYDNRPCLQLKQLVGLNSCGGKIAVSCLYRVLLAVFIQNKEATTDSVDRV